MARRKKKKDKDKDNGWEGWEDKVEFVDKLPPLGPTDQAPLTVAELEAKGFKGEDIETYRKRSPFRKKFERQRKQEEGDVPLTVAEIEAKGYKGKPDPFREVGDFSPKPLTKRGSFGEEVKQEDTFRRGEGGIESGTGALSTSPPKRKDFRRPQDKEPRIADPTLKAGTDRTPAFSKAIASAAPADEKIANLYIAEIKKDPTNRYPKVNGKTIQQQDNAEAVQALVSKYTNTLEFARTADEGVPSMATQEVEQEVEQEVDQEELPRVVDPEKPAKERKGTLSQDNFNPLDVKWVDGGVANQHAAKDANGEPLRDTHDHLIFPNAKAGWAGGRADVEAKISGKNQHGLTADSTLASFGQVYAKDPEWANKVAQMLGVDTSITVGELPVDDFIEKMAHQEGWYKGREDQAEKFAEGAEDELSPTIDPKKKKPMVRPTTPFIPEEPRLDAETIETVPVAEFTSPEAGFGEETPVTAEELPPEIEFPAGTEEAVKAKTEKGWADAPQFFKVTKEEGVDVVDEKSGFGGFLKGAAGAIKRKVTSDDRPDYIRKPQNEEVSLEIDLKKMYPKNPQTHQSRMARQAAQQHFMNTYLADEYRETTTSEGGVTKRSREAKGVMMNLSPSTYYDKGSGILYVTYKPRKILWNGRKVLEEQDPYTSEGDVTKRSR